MKVLIVGLGMIGSSYAKALTSKGYSVYGVSRKEETITKALELKIILQGSLNPDDFISMVDLIVLAMYPDKNIEFMHKYQSAFLTNQIITDVGGIKSFVKDLPEIKAEFIGSHPIAGSEKSGISAMNEQVFLNANFIITPFHNTEKAINTITQMAKDIGFGKISTITCEMHDELIAFTSQLTHAIAVCLVNSDDNPLTPSFTGDSYRDLTRIAMINEELWSELFIGNKTNLLNQITKFQIQIADLKKAIENNDQEKLKELFIHSKEIRKRF